MQCKPFLCVHILLVLSALSTFRRSIVEVDFDKLIKMFFKILFVVHEDRPFHTRSLSVVRLARNLLFALLIITCNTASE